ncbi:MAG: hypothetical protein ACKVQS_02330 [Fimbriimonadaceae bacterium]
MSTSASFIWIKRRTESLDKVMFLEIDSANQRLSKIEKLTNETLRSKSAEDVYQLAHYLIAFRNELRGKSFMGKSLSAISDSAGSTDPEFWRTAYTALCLNDGGYPGWKNLGSKVVKSYPQDMLLLEAYVWDSVTGNKEIEQLRFALSRFRSALKPILNQARGVELECWLTLGIFARTRSDTDYKEAKKYMQEYITHINDKDKQKSMHDRLSAYVKKWG